MCRHTQGPISSVQDSHGDVLLPSAVEQLRNLEPERLVYEGEPYWTPDGELRGARRVMRPHDLGRAREIIEAYDKWDAIVRAVGRKYGTDKWDDEIAHVVDVRNEVLIKIMSSPAHTLEGLKVKAQAALIDIETSNHDPVEDYDEGSSEPADLLQRIAWNILKRRNPHAGQNAPAKTTPPGCEPGGASSWA
jgi:hypothetical protein